MLNLTATIIATIIAASTLNSLPKLSQEHTSDITSMTQEQRIKKAKALYEEGYDYFYGITRPMNRTKAVEYFGGAGKLENADALFFLSIHQQNHDNLKEATQTAKRSLELGNEAAKIKLGEIQEDEKLMKEGFNALKKKVDSGDMHYANSLGYAYEFGIGTSLSIKEAMKYLSLIHI